MTNMNNFLQDILNFELGKKVFNDLLVVPGKAFWEFSTEYFSGPGLNFLSFFGNFIVLFGAAALIALTAHLLRLLFEHTVFLYKEYRRKQIRAIRKHERERTMERMAAERQFEEMYNQYGNADYSNSL